MPVQTPFFVYIVICSNNVLYTGITQDLELRLKFHNSGRGAQLTRARGPVHLLWNEQQRSQECALKRERQIKGWTRRKKMALINGDFELLKRL